MPDAERRLGAWNRIEIKIGALKGPGYRFVSCAEAADAQLAG